MTSLYSGTVHRDILYLFPVPGSTGLSPNISIILRFAQDFNGDPAKVFQQVEGSSSGVHQFVSSFDVRNRILSIRMMESFSHGERVTVQMLLNNDRVSCHFQISSTPFDHDDSVPNRNLLSMLEKESTDKIGKVTTINGISVPSDFPVIKVRKTGETAAGRIFFASTFTDLGNYLVICNEDGSPYFYRRYDSVGYGSGDFKVQSPGLLSAFMYEPAHYIILDNNYVEIDTFKAGHGYVTDSHECQLLPDGHALLVALDPQKVDMSKLINGGKTNVTAVGNNIQKVDGKGNVYFEWRSWDHYNIVDAIYENLKSDYIDYVHINSIAVDYDGHYIISCRNLSEVTKINSTTGDIIWRLGGVNNQFAFINDEYQISYQHDCRPLPGKPDHYTLFDNGNSRLPYFSRAVEWKLDTSLMTAEKVWEFRYQPDRQCFMGGSVQRLSNGNTFIDWSMWPPLHNCEVTPGGDIVFEMDAEGTSTYRSHRFEWEGMMKIPYLIIESQYDRLVLIHNKFGDENVSYYKIYGGIHKDPVQLLATSATTVTELTHLTNNDTWTFRVTAVDHEGVESGFSNSVMVPVHFTRPDDNLLRNGDFSDGSKEWNFLVRDEALAQDSLRDGEFFIDITNGGSENWMIQLLQENIQVIFGHKYLFEFEAWAAGNRLIEPIIVNGKGIGINYSQTGPMMISRRRQNYQFAFKMKEATDYHAMVVFNCGKSDIDVFLDNIRLREIIDSPVDSRMTALPNYFRLEQNAPNPFNNRTSICYALPNPSHVKLSVFDVLGRQIATALDQNMPAGEHYVDYDGTELPTGIYFYNIRTGDGHWMIKKMVVIK